MNKTKELTNRIRVDRSEGFITCETALVEELFTHNLDEIDQEADAIILEKDRWEHLYQKEAELLHECRNDLCNKTIENSQLLSDIKEKDKRIEELENGIKEIIEFKNKARTAQDLYPVLQLINKIALKLTHPTNNG